MVVVAQLVEPRIVIPVVAGSSPVIHPNFWQRLDGVARQPRMGWQLSCLFAAADRALVSGFAGAHGCGLQIDNAGC